MSLVQASSYLFNSCPERISDVRIENKAQFIDEALETLMKVNHYLLTNKEAFPLIDPDAANNQCHLYALLSYMIQKNYSGMSEEEKKSRNEENRFLHLAIFLNYAFTTEPGLLVKVVEKALSEMCMPANKGNKLKKFVQFLKDPEHLREKAARLALNAHFKESLGENLEKSERLSLLALELNKTFAGALSDSVEERERRHKLFSELHQLSKENLIIESCHGRKGNGLYTFPKLAGIAYFIDQVKRYNIPIVFKVKVLSREGAGGTFSQATREIAPDEPAIVFESFATDGSMTLPECESEAKRCPTYFHCYVEQNRRHALEDECFYCKDAPVDLAPYKERVADVIKHPEEMFNALGADFIDKIQTSFKTHFTNHEKYPELSKIYEKALPMIETMGLDMNNPRTFSVCHVYSDAGRFAATPQLQLDMTREQFLVSRGIL